MPFWSSSKGTGGDSDAEEVDRIIERAAQRSDTYGATRPKRSNFLKPKRDEDGDEESGAGGGWFWSRRGRHNNRGGDGRRVVSVRRRLVWMVSVTMVVFTLELINSVEDRALNRFALFPRKSENLVGILLMPVLSYSTLHLLFDIVPFLITSFHLLRHSLLRGSFGIVLTWVVGGLILWLLGLPRYHYGLDLIAGCTVGQVIGLTVFDNSFLSLFHLLAVGAYVGICVSTWGAISGLTWDSWVTGLSMGLLWRLGISISE